MKILFLDKLATPSFLKSQKASLFLFLSILAIGGFLRFYKLDWGEGNFFHPDERNIAAVVTSANKDKDGKFYTKSTFAYGNLVSNVSIGVSTLRKNLLKENLTQNDFYFVSIFLRSLSALFSSLAIYTIYFIGKKFWNKKVGFLAAFLTAFSPGLIQAAHFGTFESILVFLYLWIFYFSIKILKEKRTKNFFLAIILISIASAIKINSAILLVFPTLPLIKPSTVNKIRLRKKLLYVALGILIFFLLTVLLSPYYLTEDFRRLFVYEQSLVRGQIDVFYTRQYIGTTPLVFQFLYIFPFTISPLISFFFPLLTLHPLYELSKNINKPKEFLKANQQEFFLLLLIGVLFLPSSFLYTKWSRYMIPSIPFIILFVVIQLEKIPDRWKNVVFLITMSTSLIWGLSFSSIYFRPDSRIVASKWINTNLENNSYILSETGNVLDVPVRASKEFSHNNFKVNNFDFYNLDFNQSLPIELALALEQSDYILIPSRRIFMGMANHPDKFPLVENYYKLLFSGELGFSKIKTFTSYPKIGPFEIPDEIAEETWTVFDHPVVRVYKKTKPFTKFQYEKLLKI